MTMTTKDNKYIHFAIEREALDGPFVICITHSASVVRLLMKEHQRAVESDYAAYEAASENKQDGWVFEPTQKVIPFEAGQDVWLGYPFDHAGAKEWDEDREGIGVTWPEWEKDFKELLRQAEEMDWLR